MLVVVAAESPGHGSLAATQIDHYGPGLVDPIPGETLDEPPQVRALRTSVVSRGGTEPLAARRVFSEGLEDRHAELVL
jgi:hypothetical protein